jgi:hypothetical protein
MGTDHSRTNISHAEIEVKPAKFNFSNQLWWKNQSQAGPQHVEKKNSQALTNFSKLSTQMQGTEKIHIFLHQNRTTERKPTRNLMKRTSWTHAPVSCKVMVFFFELFRTQLLSSAKSARIGNKTHAYLAILSPVGVWNPLMRTAVAVPLG